MALREPKRFVLGFLFGGLVFLALAAGTVYYGIIHGNVEERINVVTQFGAVPDGNTATPTDNTAAIQNALNYWAYSNGAPRWVYFPCSPSSTATNAIYVCSNALVIPTLTNQQWQVSAEGTRSGGLIGDGPYASTIEFPTLAATNGLTFMIHNTAQETGLYRFISNFRITGLGIWGPGYTNVLQEFAGSSADNPNITADGIFIGFDPNIAYFNTAGWNDVIDNCYIAGWHNGITVTNLVDFRVNNNVFKYNGNSCVWLSGVDTFQIERNIMLSTTNNIGTAAIVSTTQNGGNPGRGGTMAYNEIGGFPSAYIGYGGSIMSISGNFERNGAIIICSNFCNATVIRPNILANQIVTNTGNGGGAFIFGDGSASAASLIESPTFTGIITNSSLGTVNSCTNYFVCYGGSFRPPRISGVPVYAGNTFYGRFNNTQEGIYALLDPNNITLSGITFDGTTLAATGGSGSGLPGTNTVIAYGGDPATASQTNWSAESKGTWYDTNKAGGVVLSSNGNFFATAGFQGGYLSLTGAPPGSYLNIGSANSHSNTFSSPDGSNSLSLTIGNTTILAMTNPQSGNLGMTIPSGVNITNQNFGTGLVHADSNGKLTSSSVVSGDFGVVGANTVLANNTAVTTTPSFISIGLLLDVIGNSVGGIPVRAAAGWWTNSITSQAPTVQFTPTLAGNVTQTNGTYLGTNVTAAGQNWFLLSADLFKMSNGVYQTQVTLTSTNLSLAGAAINAGVSFGSGNGLSNNIYTGSGSNDGNFNFGYQTNNFKDTNGLFYMLDAAFFRNTLGVLGAVFTTNGLNVGTTLEVGGQTWASNTVTITAGGANITGVITNINSIWWQTNALSGTVWAPTIDCTQPYIGMPMWTSNLAVNGIVNVPAIGSGKVPDFWVEVTNNDSSVHQVTFPAGTTLYNSAFATNVTAGIFCSNHATVIFKVLLFPQNGQYRTNILAWQQAN